MDFPLRNDLMKTHMHKNINANSEWTPLPFKWTILNMLYLNLNIKSIFFLISGQTMSVSSFKKLEPEEYLRQHYQQGLRPDGRKGLSSLRCEIFVFSPLVPSKWEKNILVLLGLYIFWGKCVYFFEWWNSQLCFFWHNCEFYYSTIEK